MKILFQVVVVVIVLLTFILAYQRYAPDIQQGLFGTTGMYSIFVGHTPLTVSVASTVPEQTQGLSGVASLPQNDGKLFIFDTAGPQSIWMKDMRFPLDILWFDNTLKLVHIEENVSPDTYPATFSSPMPARFVLEVNARFVATHGLQLGDQLNLPASLLPADVRTQLQ